VGGGGVVRVDWVERLSHILKLEEERRELLREVERAISRIEVEEEDLDVSELEELIALSRALYCFDRYSEKVNELIMCLKFEGVDVAVDFEKRAVEKLVIEYRDHTYTVYADPPIPLTDEQFTDKLRKVVEDDLKKLFEHIEWRVVRIVKKLVDEINTLKDQLPKLKERVEKLEQQIREAVLACVMSDRK